MRKAGWLGLSFSIAVLAAGCGAGADAPAADRISRIHRSRCRTCHVRVEPGERTRGQLEAALARHHKRLRLTDEEWAEMVDYLSQQPR
jgi:hypothetical protein